MSSERKLVHEFDVDGDGRLDSAERAKARAWLKENPAPRRGFGPPGGGGNRPPGGEGRPGGGGRPGPGFFGGRGNEEPVKPGPQVSPDEVKAEPVGSLYAADTLRTLFFQFESDDWEQELEDFHGTDVDVPATLIVDGQKYPGVGVHFRGMSSYMMVSEGHKRSFNVSVDHSVKKQRLDGYKTLNLLNSHEDETFLSSVLYSQIARNYLPAPKANFVRVVINGESWGVYVNQQQFNKDFVQENFKTGKGARWKVRGSPMAQGGLDYRGEDVAEYEKHYEMKDGDKDDWQALIELCQKLEQTPPDQLEAALAPMLDIDEALWFLALDCVLINGDGYWVRASDYSIYRGKGGQFHVIPNDMNEAFRPPGGPGFGPPGGGRRRGGERPPGPDANDGPPPGPGAGAPRPNAAPERPGEPAASPGVADPAAQPNDRQPERGPEGRPPGGFPGFGNRPRVEGVKLDPLVGLDDKTKALRSKLLAVPALRERYLENVRTIADEWLTWEKLGPIVAGYRELLQPALAEDTRKLSSLESFERLTADQPAPAAEEAGGRGPRQMALRTFVEQRRDYLLKAIDEAKANPPVPAKQ